MFTFNVVDFNDAYIIFTMLCLSESKISTDMAR